MLAQGFSDKQLREFYALYLLLLHKELSIISLFRCFLVTEARGEIQNFVHNFLENPSQEGPGHQSDEEPEELNVEVVKEEQMVTST